MRHPSPQHSELRPLPAHRRSHARSPLGMESHSRFAMADEPEWNDPIFNSATQFEAAMNSDSPFPAVPFEQYTNADLYSDDMFTNMRTPGKPSSIVAAGAPQPPQSMDGMPAGQSTESSSQDSASDTSSSRKRKVTESPAPSIDFGVQKEDSMEMLDASRLQYEHVPTRPMHDLSLEHNDGVNTQYDFGSSASSPAQAREFMPAIPMNPCLQMTATTMAPQFQNSPVSAHDASAAIVGLTSAAAADHQSWHVPAGR